MKIWECKVVVPTGVELPDGFDAVPRMAVIDAIEKHKIPVYACFSGWGGTLTESEANSILNKENRDMESLVKNS